MALTRHAMSQRRQMPQPPATNAGVTYSSRFCDEDAHFAEVPGCPLRGVREGHAAQSEAACARCRYNVAFPGEAQIGCHVRTPAHIVERARRAAPDELSAALVRLQREQPSSREPWLQVAQQLLAVEDDSARELGSVIARFASATDAVEILR